MSRRSLAATTAVTCGVLVLACTLAGPRSVRVPAADDGNKPAAKEAPGKDVFGLTRVWAFHLEISAREYQAMQPAGGLGFPGGPGKPPPKPAEKRGEARDSERNLFGVEFPWVRGEFTADGKTYRKVGFRYAGNASYFVAARSLKRSFKIDLHRYGKHNFHGLETLNLHCGVLDPTRGREVLAYAVFRAAGVPAPRTAFAEVALTVPGKYDKEYLGLYTLVEQVDGNFLKDRFRTDKGLLLRPERLRGIDYLGEDWEKYNYRYSCLL
jgi:spore coat protein H